MTTTKEHDNDKGKRVHGSFESRRLLSRCWGSPIGIVHIRLGGILGLFGLRPKDVNDFSYPLCKLFEQRRHALLDLSAYAIDLLGDRERRIRDDIAQVCDGFRNVRICSLQGLRELSGRMLYFLHLGEQVFSNTMEGSLSIVDLV